MSESLYNKSLKVTIKNKLKKLIRGEIGLEEYIKNGMVVGRNFMPQKGCTFDYPHCWLISIGDNVTMAPDCKVLAHDASTKGYLKYTKIGKVRIGSNVFIGASSVILPGTIIEDRVIVGANSTVTGYLRSNGVYAGSPARYICTMDEYLAKEKGSMVANKNMFDSSYTMGGKITAEKKKEMIKVLEKYKKAFVE